MITPVNKLKKFYYSLDEYDQETELRFIITTFWYGRL